MAVEQLAEFSRCHCGLVCAFLIPAILLTTLQTLIFTGLGWNTWPIIFGSFVYSLLIILHVATWLVVGVIQVPTFILLGLALLCTAVNTYAGIRSKQMYHGLRWGFAYVRSSYSKLQVS
jgi:hypothetical protein